MLNIPTMHLYNSLSHMCAVAMQKIQSRAACCLAASQHLDFWSFFHTGSVFPLVSLSTLSYVLYISHLILLFQEAESGCLYSLCVI